MLKENISSTVIHKKRSYLDLKNDILKPMFFTYIFYMDISFTTQTTLTKFTHIYHPYGGNTVSRF